MAQTITGQFTVVSDTDSEFNSNLDEINVNTALSVVSQDSGTRTIVVDLNIQGT